MKRNEIRINRLEVRLKNGDLGRARELRATIGDELLQQIAERTSAPLNGGSIKIDRVDAGTISLKPSSQVKAGDAIARHVAAAIRPKLTQSRGGKR
jgi:hypothetical protein